MPTPDLTWPSGIIPAETKWKLPNLVGISQSPFNLKQQKYNWNSAVIRASVTVRPQNEAQGRRLAAFLWGCGGRAKTFLYGDYRAAQVGPQGTGGTGTVSTANQTGDTLVTTMSAGQALPGDWIGLPATGRMHMVTSVVSPGTFKIKPPLRESPASGATVTTNSAGGGTPIVQAVFQLATNLGEFTDVNPVYEFPVLEIEEAWS